ncbi:SUMF1/EgtB/PvdO family nonheme iron enzyme [bacterium]|nr:SUMF1/EgtB/PvdO family nonheme iron enzyme [bacterium]
MKATFVMLLIASHISWGATEGSCPTNMVQVPAGAYQPLFRAAGDPETRQVDSFRMDPSPVTNGQFLEFVRANPRWRRSQVKRLFADEHYLQHWAADFDLGSTQPDQPVVWVSWFAAKAYAAWQGKRLPTVDEWEYAASASPTRLDGRNDPVFQAALQRWYSTPAPEVLPRVRLSVPNIFGLYDLHGLVWEWTSDFNSATFTGDSRSGGGVDRQFFCAAGSIGAKDTADFPAFIRYGFRSSLKASYTVHNLGFRCAKSLSETTTQKLTNGNADIQNQHPSTQNKN